MVHVIIGFHQFFPPISWIHHDVSWVLVVRSFSVLFFRFHPSSSPKSSLYHSFSSVFSQLLVTRFYLFSPTTCSFYHWRSSFSPSIPWFYHEISISFPHLFVHFSLGFISFPHILAHLVTVFFGFLHFFLLSVDFIMFPSYCNVCIMHYLF